MGFNNGGFGGGGGGSSSGGFGGGSSGGFGSSSGGFAGGNSNSGGRGRSKGRRGGNQNTSVFHQQPQHNSGSRFGALTQQGGFGSSKSTARASANPSQGSYGFEAKKHYEEDANREWMG